MRAVRTPMSKAAREYHLIDLVGISHGGFVSLAGARQFARQEGLSAWDSFTGMTGFLCVPQVRKHIAEDSTLRRE
jgi:hypothetical protein